MIGKIIKLDISERKIVKKSWMYVLGCYIIWGVFPLFWNLLTGIDAAWLLGWRGLWAGVVVAIFITVRRDWTLLWQTMQDWKVTLRFAVAGLLIYTNWGIYIWCTTNGHVLDASLAYYVNPLLSILLGLAVFGERLKGRQWLAVGITLVGVVYTIVVAGKAPWLSLLMAGTFALYGVLKKPVPLPYQISLAIETITIAPVSIVVLLWCQHQGVQMEYAALGWRWILIPISGVVTIVPLALFAKGIAGTRLTVIGMLQYTSPTLQMLSALVLGNVLTGDDCVLFGCVWLGILVYIVPDLWQLLKEKGERVCESSVVSPEGDA